MKLAQIILLEVTQTKKDICHMFCLMGGTYFKSSDMRYLDSENGALLEWGKREDARWGQVICPGNWRREAVSKGEEGDETQKKKRGSNNR